MLSGQPSGDILTSTQEGEALMSQPPFVSHHAVWVEIQKPQDQSLSHLTSPNALEMLVRILDYLL